MQITAEFSAVAVHGVTGCLFWAVYTDTRPGVTPAIRAGNGVAGTPGACSHVFCHPIRCMLVMRYRQRYVINTQSEPQPPQPPHTPWPFWLKTSPVSRGGVLGSFRSVGTLKAHSCQCFVLSRSFNAFIDAVALFEPCCRSRLWCSWCLWPAAVSWSGVFDPVVFPVLVVCFVHDVWEVQGS